MCRRPSRVLRLKAFFLTAGCYGVFRVQGSGSRFGPGLGTKPLGVPASEKKACDTRRVGYAFSWGVQGSRIYRA